MIDSSGVRITKDELFKNMTKVSMFKEIRKKLQSVNMSLKWAYIEDGDLKVHIESKSGFIFYVDRFESDKKHAKIRLVVKQLETLGWVESKPEIDQYVKLLNKHAKVLEWLQTQDFSGLYYVSEKKDNEVPLGNFGFSTNHYCGIAIKKIIDDLSKYYDVEDIHGQFFNNGSKIFVITENLAHSKEHFAPTKFDLHIYENKEKNAIFEKRFALSLWGSAYNSFFVDKIINADEKVEIVLRNCISIGHKCSDTFYADAIIDCECAKTKVGPFIFSKRYAEKSYDYQDFQDNAHYSFIYTNGVEDVNMETAVEESKKRMLS